MSPRDDRPPPRGLWFEDFSVGQAFESDGRTVTESDVVAFAGVSGDFTPLHVDAEYAARTPFRQRIAHGLLIQSIASGLARGTGIFEGTLLALSEITMRFVRPVFLGDTIRLRLEVVELDAEPGPKRARVRFSTVVTNQTGETVLEGAWSVVFLRRRSGAPVATAGDNLPEDAR
jgi:acyl dehydratase